LLCACCVCKLLLQLHGEGSSQRGAQPHCDWGIVPHRAPCLVGLGGLCCSVVNPVVLLLSSILVVRGPCKLHVALLLTIPLGMERPKQAGQRNQKSRDLNADPSVFAAHESKPGTLADDGKHWITLFHSFGVMVVHRVWW